MDEFGESKAKWKKNHLPYKRTSVYKRKITNSVIPAYKLFITPLFIPYCDCYTFFMSTNTYSKSSQMATSQNGAEVTTKLSFCLNIIIKLHKMTFLIPLKCDLCKVLQMAMFWSVPKSAICKKATFFKKLFVW